MATLPSLTRTLDDDFVNTWYEVRAAVMDNILEATILTLALKEFGCMKQQIGGEYGWTDTVGYGEKATQRFQAGSTLTQEVKKLDTFAKAPWRFFCVDVNRSMVDDMKNMGKFQIKSYLARRLEAARSALVQDMETYLFQWGTYYAAPEQPKGLWDIVAPQTALTAGGGTDCNTYASGASNGGINRTNAFWRNWIAYDDASQDNDNFIAGATNEPYSLNLVPDMRHFWNSVTAGQDSPNFIIAGQNIYEAYEDEAADKMQIVRTAFNRKAADLGFESITFKGATMTYSTKMEALHVAMLNLNHVEWNYHPNAWFDMTNWKETANQLERVAYIVCMTPGLTTSQPRRHGVMVYAS
jgi:hypothetical protein